MKSLQYIKEELAELRKGPIDDDAIETALKKKADESKISINILRTVMRRGMDAWNTSHRAGVTQQAWGYARVNAFIDKKDTVWNGSDKDLAELSKK